MCIFIALGMPKIFDYEKMILLENFKNPYQNALFSLLMAASKPDVADQRALLLECLNYCNKAIKNEDSFKSLTVDNSVLVKATDLILNRPEKSVDEIFPLTYISLLRYIKKSEIPSQPLLVARTTKTLMMRTPYFKPITEYKNWRNIDKIAIF